MAPPPAGPAQGTMSNYLFVYGTLLRQSQHPMAKLLAERAQYRGEAKIRARLYDLGRYPGILEPQTEADWVYGNLYDLGAPNDLLAQLDAYEEVESPRPAYFDRQLGEAIASDGKPVPTWIYWYRGEVNESHRVVSGRYECKR